MTEMNDRISIFSAKSVELITDENSGFAVASISKNPNITWIKFILLDDKPNANKHRVPKEEFSNVIKTGLFMPLKMASASEDKEHFNSEPLGVITHLVEKGELIEAIAALWNTERLEDVASIKAAYKEGKDINLSWELHYTDYEEENDDVLALKNIALNAATIVDIPAYGGRTNVTALAGVTTEGENMDTINKTEHDAIVAEFEQKVSELAEKVEALEAQLTEANDTLAQSSASLDEANEELTTLREFKSVVEAEQQKASKLNEVKERFVEAGLELDSAFFTDREEFLLGLASAELDFYIQDITAFNKGNVSEDNKGGDSSASVTIGSKLPNVEKNTDKKEYKSVLDYLQSKN